MVDKVIPMKNEDQESQKIKSSKAKNLLKELKEWSDLPYLEHSTFMGFYVPFAFTRYKAPLKLYASDAETFAKLGCSEGIATKLNTLVMLDKNHDGNFTDDEQREATSEEVATITNAYLSLFQNVGVIAALMISVIFPLTIANGLTISQKTIDFFGYSCAQAFYYIFLILVNVIVIASLYVIFIAIHMYKHLSFWMSTPKAQLSWIGKSNMRIVAFIVTGSTILDLLAAVIPFGAVSFGGPIAGLISLIVVLIFFLMMFDFMVAEECTQRILHEEVRSVVNKYYADNNNNV